MKDTKAGVKSEFYGNEFETDSNNNLEVEVDDNKSYLPGPRNEFETNFNNNLEVEVAGNKSLLISTCLVEYNIPEDTKSMIEFNIICSSPLAKLVSATID